MNLEAIGMSGHSFGAITAQADAKRAFANVQLPWMLMTGTKDEAPIGNATAASRREVFPLLPAGHKYELVLDGAEHSVFTDSSLPGDRGERNPHHHPAIEALSTAFFDSYLREDKAAQGWLDGAGPRSILDPADQWQRK